MRLNSTRAQTRAGRGGGTTGGRVGACGGVERGAGGRGSMPEAGVGVRTPPGSSSGETSPAGTPPRRAMLSPAGPRTPERGAADAAAGPRTTPAGLRLALQRAEAAFESLARNPPPGPYVVLARAEREDLTGVFLDLDEEQDEEDDEMDEDEDVDDATDGEAEVDLCEGRRADRVVASSAASTTRGVALDEHVYGTGIRVSGFSPERHGGAGRYGGGGRPSPGVGRKAGRGGTPLGELLLDANEAPRGAQSKGRGGGAPPEGAPRHEPFSPSPLSTRSSSVVGDQRVAQAVEAATAHRAWAAQGARLPLSPDDVGGARMRGRPRGSKSPSLAGRSPARASPRGLADAVDPLPPILSPLTTPGKGLWDVVDLDSPRTPPTPRTPPAAPPDDFVSFVTAAFGALRDGGGSGDGYDGGGEPPRASRNTAMDRRRAAAAAAAAASPTPDTW